MILNKSTRERSIETFLRHYNTYLVGLKNCQKQLDYILPSLVTGYSHVGPGLFFISNDTERVALDRIESKRAIDLREEIERNKIIIESIDNAMNELSEVEKRFIILRYFESKPIAEVTEALGYAEVKTIFRIRRQVLDKLLISLNNLLTMV